MICESCLNCGRYVEEMNLSPFCSNSCIIEYEEYLEKEIA